MSPEKSSAWGSFLLIHLCTIANYLILILPEGGKGLKDRIIKGEIKTHLISIHEKSGTDYLKILL
jgi:hypothetical protein